VRALSLDIRNFLSFGRAKIQLARRGLVLIEGENKDDPTARSNGAAKSAIVEAFVWCVQGTTLRGYVGDDVINRKVGKNCRVTTVWKDRGSKWKIVRTRQDDKLKTSLNLYHDGRRVTGSTVADTQELIDRMLGMTAKTFLSSVVFGQSNAYRFSSLTDTEQKAILDEALGIEAYAEAGVAARDKVSVHSVNVDTLKQTFDDTAAEIEKAEQERDRAGDRERTFKADQEAKLKEVQGELDEVNERLTSLVKSDVKTLRDQLKTMRDVLRNRERDVESLKENAAKMQAEHGTLHREVGRLEREISRHEELKGDCPTCGQEIDADDQAEVLYDMRKQLKNAQASAREAQEAADNADRKARAEASRLHKEREGVSEVEDAIERAEKLNTKRAGLVERAKALQRRLDEIKEEKNPYRRLVKEAEQKVTKLIEERERVRADLAKEEAELELYEFWQGAFGAKGLRSLLIDTALPILNERVDHYARAITGGSIHIEFKTESLLKSGKTVDKFEVAVTNEHGAGNYKGNSAGEKAKVDLCVGLALQALVASRAQSGINVAFFDEPFESLDDAAIERVATLLTEELTDRESVFVITHNEALKAFFPNVLTVVKEGGMSHVE